AQLTPIGGKLQTTEVLSQLPPFQLSDELAGFGVEDDDAQLVRQVATRREPLPVRGESKVRDRPLTDAQLPDALARGGVPYHERPPPDASSLLGGGAEITWVAGRGGPPPAVGREDGVVDPRPVIEAVAAEPGEGPRRQSVRAERRPTRESHREGQ